MSPSGGWQLGRCRPDPVRPQTPSPWPRLDDRARSTRHWSPGVRDYMRKNRFTSVVIALSGGIDSALVAAIAVDASAPRTCTGLMPSGYSSSTPRTTPRTWSGARAARRDGADPAMVDAFEAELGLTGLAEENLQARIRGMVLMALSNQEDHLVLTTGNKSELATGYSTLYGDSAGGYAPIKDVFKTLVWGLARWRNREAAGAARPPRSRRTRSPSRPARNWPRARWTATRSRTTRCLTRSWTTTWSTTWAPPSWSRRARPQPGRPRGGTGGPRGVQAPAVPARPQDHVKNFGRDRRLPITNRWREPRSKEGTAASPGTTLS